MKKRLTILIIFVATVLFVGCNNIKTNIAKANNEEMFIVVEDNWEYDIVYDRETKVMYTYSKGDSGYRTDYDNRGVFTILVDENGNPKLWDGGMII